jgi:hypothetical protein
VFGSHGTQMCVGGNHRGRLRIENREAGHGEPRLSSEEAARAGGFEVARHPLQKGARRTHSSPGLAGAAGAQASFSLMRADLPERSRR